MRRIGPPSKGTLSTATPTVNQLHLPHLVGTAADKPRRVVRHQYDNTGRIVGRLYDTAGRLVEHADDKTARTVAPASGKASRTVGASVVTPTTRVVAPPADKTTRTVAPPADNVVRVVLVGCSKKKRAGRHPARALYQGALFKAELAHAQRIGAEAFIVSARHGLVQLDTELDAYDYKLRTDERETWAWTVCVALRRHMKRRRFAVTIFAGETYAAPLQKYLAAIDPTIEVVAPLDGLSLGAQLRWFRVAASIAGGVQ